MLGVDGGVDGTVGAAELGSEPSPSLLLGGSVRRGDARAGVEECLVTVTGAGFCHVKVWSPASRLSE